MRCAVVLLVLLQLPSISAAQSGADRVALSAWEDSLARVTDPVGISRYESPARKGPGASHDVRVALLQLRKATLTNSRGQLELALIRLVATSAGHRNWPWPDYLMARTFFALGQRDAPVVMSAGLVEGESHIEAAWRHLHYALAMDPTFPPARRLAAATLIAQGDRELRSDEHDAVRVLLRFDPDADALLAAARDARAREKYDSSIALLDRAVAAKGDYSRLQMERARTLNATGDTAAAAAAYWDGAAHLSAIGREAYRYDLAWILAPDSLKAFDAVPDDSVGDWLRVASGRSATRLQRINPASACRSTFGG